MQLGFGRGGPELVSRRLRSRWLNAARLLGITICVSSGDDGSGDELGDGQAHVDFPGSSPFVLSVGGTMLTETAGSLDEVTGGSHRVGGPKMGAAPRAAA